MTTYVSPKPRHVRAVRKALAQWHADTAEHGPSDATDRMVIDHVLRHLASLGEPFGANEARELLPAVRTCLIGRRFMVAQHQGWLAKVGYTPSTLPSTKGHPVALYAPVVTA